MAIPQNDPAYENYVTNVMPLFEQNGYALSPEFAEAVNKHVKQFGPRYVSLFHSANRKPYPNWFDSETLQMKPLKQIWVEV